MGISKKVALALLGVAALPILLPALVSVQALQVFLELMLLPSKIRAAWREAWRESIVRRSEYWLRKLPPELYHDDLELDVEFCQRFVNAVDSYIDNRWLPDGFVYRNQELVATLAYEDAYSSVSDQMNKTKSSSPTTALSHVQ